MSNIFDKFYETFNIAKIEYSSPGRTVDGDGEICEWYLDYEYPSIEPVFFDLLNILDVQYNTDKINTFLNDYDLRLNLVQGLLNLYETLDPELKEELKRDVKDVFDEYYSVKECENPDKKEWVAPTPSVKLNLTKQLKLQDENLSLISESIINKFIIALSYYEQQIKEHPELEGLIELQP